MVTIKKIEDKKDTISCDYYPEGKETKGKIVVDKATRKIVEIDYARPFDDEIYCTYACMARTKLLEICKNDTFPQEITVMWY